MNIDRKCAPKRKNLIVFYTDQLRRDALGCCGNPIAKTPNLDALARRGVVFHNHYAANPVCSPSRASFFTGRHLQAHRLIDNGIALSPTEITLPQVLAENGYRTHSVGKIHLTPHAAAADAGFEESRAAWAAGAMDGWTGPYYGFQSVELSILHGDSSTVNGGHYSEWVRANFPELAPQIEQYRTGKVNQLGASPLPLEANRSTWVADRSIEFIKNRKECACREGEAPAEPFFLFASFPDPHHPFVCPEPYFSMFKDADFPPPHRREGENDAKPEHYRRAMTERQFFKDGGAHRPDMDENEWRTILAATYGMVALIDASIGRILEALREAGLEDSTTIAFTSDHGDFLGDHWFLFKGPLPCRSLLNIPFIVADSDMAPRETDAVMSNVDAMPTLLDLLGVESPACVQGRSMVDVIRGGPGDDEHVALECGWSKESPRFYHHTIYTDKWRISYFPGQDDGELYDLQNDPHELDNLYHKPEYGEVRNEMMLRLYREVGRAEPSFPPVVANW